MRIGLKAVISAAAILVISAAVGLLISFSPALRGGFGEPEPPPPPPSDGPDSPALVDEILRHLRTASAALEAPSEMNLGETSGVKLLLSPLHTVPELEAMLDEHQLAGGGTVRISNRMEAHLTGPGFKIEAITQETQAVGTMRAAEWQWVIEPTTAGMQTIHLSLSALIEVQGSATPYPLQTFERRIDVRVTAGQRIGGFVAKRWPWLWGAIVVPIAGWAIRKYRRRRAADA